MKTDQPQDNLDQELAKVFPGIQSPEQIFDLIQNPQMKEFMTLVAAGQGLVKNQSHPDWAMRAMQEFWRTCFDLPRTKQAKSEMFRLGFLYGLISRAKPELFGDEADLLKMFGTGALEQFVHTIMRNAPADDASTFYAGYSVGILRSESLSLSAPSLVYVIISIGWRHAASCRNVGEMQAWLDGILGRNLTGSRDRVAKLCQKIGFPLSDKGGRPKGKPRKRVGS